MDATVQALIKDISEGIRVLRIRDGVPLTEEQIAERANNIVCGLNGSYKIKKYEDDETD